MKSQRYRQSDLIRQPGELARLKVSQGPDAGSTFVLFDRSISIGRGDGCDVVVSDLKASRHHANLKFRSHGWEISDRGSSNGIIHNGASTRKANIRTGDQFSLGETTFEFLTAVESTDLLTASPSDGSHQRQNLEKERLVQEKRIQALTSIGDRGTPLSKISTNRVGSKTGIGRQSILMVLLAGIAIWVLFDEDPPIKKRSANRSETKVRDLASFLPDSEVSKEVRFQADVFFKMGFREFRERNFLRAQTHFETVLQIYPTHKLAEIYLNNCRSEIKSEIQFHLERGRKSFDSGKLRSARGHFEYIVRFLRRTPNHPNYLEAKEKLDALKDIKKGRS